MIKLCNIPNRIIDTSKFDNLLHDAIVTNLEKEIAKYVGAKYACALDSCTSAVFLALKLSNQSIACTVPTLSTTRFLGAITQAGSHYQYTDDIDWIGRNYTLWKSEFKIIDSAQRLDPNQYKAECNDEDLLLFSFYPTKPVGGLQGGMIVSNDKQKIEWIRQASNFGEDFSVESWRGSSKFIGYQKFMNSVSASMAMSSFQEYPEKRRKLDAIRDKYNYKLGGELDNGSYHLYRIKVINNDRFVEKAYEHGIICGIHYKPAHKVKAYELPGDYPKSEALGMTGVSLPFHIKLTDKEISKITTVVNKYA